MILPGLPPPDTGILHTESAIDFYVNNRNVGTGVLYVAQSRLCWAPADNSPGLSMDYPNISIHAVCRDVSKFPQKEHVYLMLDTDLFPEENFAENDDEDDETLDPEDKYTSIYLAPANPANLDVIYKAITDAQILHPPRDQLDSEDEYDEDEGEYELPAEDGLLDGALPGVQYQNQPYEENMENGLGEPVYQPQPPSNGSHGGVGGGDDDEEDMEQDQFQDAL